jgi:hypothetical protein
MPAAHEFTSNSFIYYYTSPRYSAKKDVMEAQTLPSEGDVMEAQTLPSEGDRAEQYVQCIHTDVKND